MAAPVPERKPAVAAGRELLVAAQLLARPTMQLCGNILQKIFIFL